MKIRIAVLLTILSIPLSVDAGQDPPITTAAPKGSYQVVALNLSEGLTGKPQTLQLTFRDDRLVSFWFLRQDYERINLLSSTVKHTKDKLTGTLGVRLCSQTTKREHYGFAELTFDLSIVEGKLQGSYKADTRPGTATPSQIKERSWKGKAEGSRVEPTDPVRSQDGWPAFAGPHGNMTAPEGPELINDLGNARPLWQSEAAIPVSYGNAPDSRYFWRAAGAGSGGGACSPVIADGKVFIGYHRPSQSSEPNLDNPYWKRKYPTEEARLADLRQSGMLPHEAQRLRDHFRPLADDVMIAMDATTGATLWKTVLPMRSFNLQTHKHRGLSGVPLVAEGRLFYPNLHGRVYSLDEKTGKLLWEWPLFEAPPEVKHRPRGPQNPSPLLLTGALIWMRGKTVGLDPATGKEKWTNPFSGHGMRHWRHREHDYVIAGSLKGVACIEARTGRTIWRSREVLGFSQGYGNQSHSELVVDGDVLVSFRKTGEKKPWVYRVSGWKLSLDGMKLLWEDKPLVPDENLSIAINKGVAWCLGRHLVRCLDVKTGKQICSLTGHQFGTENNARPGSNSWLAIIGKKMLLSPEGQHGRHGFLWFETDPKSLRKLGAFWIPPHPTTTAYNGQPLAHPIVDGRLFMRGGDAIYCYDLRLPK